MSFALSIKAFRNGDFIPARYTCDGSDVNPPIEWSGEPETTKSFALIVDDPDAPRGVWNHWLLWDIPANVHSLPEKPNVGVGGSNDFGRLTYGGPCPPRGHGPHRYSFRLYALDTPTLSLPGGANRAKLDAALAQHVVAEAEYMGRYERR
jgi:Raf kinase inhibitor-like YbhB/YbcL family protein